MFCTLSKSKVVWLINWCNMKENGNIGSGSCLAIEASFVDSIHHYIYRALVRAVHLLSELDKLNSALTCIFGVSLLNCPLLCKKKKHLKLWRAI